MVKFDSAGQGFFDFILENFSEEMIFEVRNYLEHYEDAEILRVDINDNRDFFVVYIKTYTVLKVFTEINNGKENFITEYEMLRGLAENFRELGVI